MVPDGNVPRYRRVATGRLFYFCERRHIHLRKLENYHRHASWSWTPPIVNRWRITQSNFIECLCHTKGTWAGKPFELIDWQEQIIRDIFWNLKAKWISPVQYRLCGNS